MPCRRTAARSIAVAVALLGLAGCADRAQRGDQLWPYGFGPAEGPADPPRLIAPEQAPAA